MYLLLHFVVKTRGKVRAYFNLLHWKRLRTHEILQRGAKFGQREVMFQNRLISLACVGTSGGPGLAESYPVAPTASVKDKVFELVIFVIGLHDEITAAQPP